jgi:hypothetical protein
MPRTDLEILSQVRIASPCSVGWDSMEGDDRVRHCAQCDKLVYNLAKLTAEEAVALLRAPGGPPCIQLWRRADGTVLTADCPVGRKLVAKRKLRVAAAAALAIGLGLAGTCAWAQGSPVRGRVRPSQQLGGKPQMDPRPLAGEPCPLPTPPRRRPRHRAKPKALPPAVMGDVAIAPSTSDLRQEMGGVRPMPQR